MESYLAVTFNPEATWACPGEYDENGDPIMVPCDGAYEVHETGDRSMGCGIFTTFDLAAAEAYISKAKTGAEAELRRCVVESVDEEY
jgi:hypothetical protein